MSEKDAAPAPGVQSSGALNLSLLSAASALLAAAVGASYAYVDLSLNRMGASSTAIGLNAAMPALGWLLATPLMPWALRQFNSRWLLVGLLLAAALGLLGFPLFPDTGPWMISRFLFGGSAGMVFRLVEYWINTASAANHRARNVGIYSAAFAIGAMLGAGATPLVGLAGWPPVIMMLGLLCAATVLFTRLKGGPPQIEAPPTVSWHGLGRPAFIAFCAILTYGLFEPVPYTLMPVYIVRLGLADKWAVWAASAFVGGQIIAPVPVGLIADRWGKIPVMIVCAFIALLIPAIIPRTIDLPGSLIVTMVIWGGLGGSLYAIALAVLADHFQGADLAGANATFGTLYALGNLAGPPLHGLAMDWRNPQGLMFSAALLFSLFLCCAFWQWQRLRRSKAST